MSEETNLENDNHKPQEPEKSQDVVLTIKISPEGQFSVQGPGNGTLFDEPKCFWLLYKALRHIEISNARAQQSSIVQPNKPGGIINFAKRFKR